ncbi:TPA: hypothetical protein QIC24_004375 [Enterobacter ludwigii]|nr:hypothetical protein [Enterobacter ludwigii]HDT0813131.1 hypothetical protein [Enterobacter ludwigii]
MPFVVRPLTFEFTFQPGIKATQSTSTLNNSLIQEKILHTDVIRQWLVCFRNRRWRCGWFRQAA